MKVLTRGVFILAGAIVLAGCTHIKEPGQDLIPIEEFDASKVEDAPASDISRAEFDYEIDMAEFSYTPNTIQAQPGQNVRIKLTNSQGMHDFVITELGVASEVIQQGEETMVELDVPPTAAGQTFEFYCSVGNHRQMGMVGSLVVGDGEPAEE